MERTIALADASYNNNNNNNNRRNRSRNRRKIPPPAHALEDDVCGETTVGMDEVELVVKYMDANRDNRITFDELEGAFRRARRVQAHRHHELHGRRLLARLEDLIHASGEYNSVGEWFERMDQAGLSRADGTVTMRELRIGLARLRLSRGGFSKKELVALMRYMDPSGDGELSIEEVMDSFRRLHEVSDAKRNKKTSFSQFTSSSS